MYGVDVSEVFVRCNNPDTCICRFDMTFDMTSPCL